MITLPLAAARDPLKGSSMLRQVGEASLHGQTKLRIHLRIFNINKVRSPSNANKTAASDHRRFKQD
jgi:hypothetical protein